MAVADIYTIFRRLIGDETTDYTVPDKELMKYLDLGIDKLSESVSNIVNEDVAVSDSDKTNGYIEMSNYYINFLSNGLGEYGENVYWQYDDGNKKINFIDTDGIATGTFEFVYRKRYKTFDGTVRDDDYFDYPRRADLGVVFWALGEYMQSKGIITVDDLAGTVSSKSEEGLSVSYGMQAAMQLSSPSALKLEAMRIFMSLSNATNMAWSISV